jgi:phosphatidylinositol 3-kinase
VKDLEGRTDKDDGSLFILNPNKIIDRLLLEKVRVFRSNTSPFLMMYKTKDDGKYNLIYKDGDDLRTDVLIMQMIYLMDTLMKSLNVDLKLTVYQILAYGSSDGIMECVDDSETVQALLQSHSNKLYNYFLNLTLERAQKENPQLKTLSVHSDVKQSAYKDISNQEIAMAIQRIDPSIMNNYIESLAGYCVITYLLGIGDRHLENLMIDKNGKLFHIDFGYAMGEDPKWNPPLFKLTNEMINAMGGVQSEYYTYFENKCVTYFITLRKHSKLLLNLMHLMVDSNIIVNPKKGIPLKRESLDMLAQRLILNENEKKAEIYFKKLMKECINSNLGVIYDKIHVMAGYFG